MPSRPLLRSQDSLVLAVHQIQFSVVHPKGAAGIVVCVCWLVSDRVYLVVTSQDLPTGQWRSEGVGVHTLGLRVSCLARTRHFPLAKVIQLFNRFFRGWGFAENHLWRVDRSPSRYGTSRHGFVGAEGKDNLRLVSCNLLFIARNSAEGVVINRDELVELLRHDHHLLRSTLLLLSVGVRGSNTPPFIV